MTDAAEHYVVCPTCGFIEQITCLDTERAERPCPECGWTLVLAVYTEDEDGDCGFAFTWHEDDGAAPLYLPDLQKAIGRVNGFLKETARREERLTQMRLERQQQSED